MTEFAARVIVLQDGARLHYAVPEALHQAGILERVYTEWYSAPNSPSRVAAKLLALGGMELGVRMLDRVSPNLPADCVWSNPMLTLQSRARRKSFKNDSEYFIDLARRTAEWVIKKGFGKGTVLFGFIRNIHPLLLAEARKQGLVTMGDQMIAPYAVEHQEEEKQIEKFPGWTSLPSRGFDALMNEMEHKSWENLDVTTCASDYVKGGLVGEGIAADKIHVLPYPIHAGKYPHVNREGRKAPLTVGFVGSVGLRKGAPYFFEVARRFDVSRVRFVMVGPVHLSEKATAERGNVELIGSVPRSQVRTWLERFDVFLFPSTCEGSAGAISEALACGLPVIASRNSGSAMKDVLPFHDFAYDDIDGMGSALDSFLCNDQKRLEIGERSRQSLERFSIREYGRALKDVLVSASRPV